MHYLFEFFLSSFRVTEDREVEPLEILVVGFDLVFSAPLALLDDVGVGPLTFGLPQLRRSPCAVLPRRCLVLLTKRVHYKIHIEAGVSSRCNIC